MDDPNILLDELKRLRKGRGIDAPKISEQVGPALRMLCGVGRDDSQESIRLKVRTRLDAMSASLPDDLALAVAAALALHTEARQPFLRERIQWLAEQLDRDERTARRRVDEGLVLLADAAAGPVPSRPHAAADAGDDWYVAAFHALLRLDLAAPEAIERREIVASQDGLDRIEALVSLPRDPTARGSAHDLLAEVLYGATVVGKEHDTESRFRFVLELPAPLEVGQRHEYGLVYRVPPNQRMRTHYVFIPRRRCDFFDLRVRFDPRLLPERIWRVSEAFHRTVDEELAGTDELTPDRASEIHLSFRNLRPGFGYGAQWRNGTTYELRHDGAAASVALPATRSV